MKCSHHQWEYLGDKGPNHDINRFKCRLCGAKAETVRTGPSTKLIKRVEESHQ